MATADVETAPVAEAPNGAAENPAAGGAAAAAGELSTEITRLKAILDAVATAERDALLEALARLKALGSIPTKVLGDTLIGRTVNQVAKGATDEAVQAAAKGLVEEWKQMHRKRKADGNGVDATASLKRANTTTLGLSSEVSQDIGQSLSQPEASQAEASQTDASQTSLERKDSLFVAPETSGGVDAKAQKRRDKVKEKIIEALGKEESLEAKGEGEELEPAAMRDPAVLAGEIEEELQKQLPAEKDYMIQARAILFNLNDKKNLSFRFKLMVGFFKPSQVPMLSAESMASDDKNAERKSMRQYAMEAIQSDWDLQNGGLKICGLFTCGKCKGMKTTYFQMQTRSSDEPMTTFVTCLTCNNRWKFC